MALVEKRVPLDIITLHDELDRMGAGVDACSVAEFTDAVPTSANIQHYASIVRQMSLSRKLQRFGVTWADKVARAPEDDHLTPMLNQLKAFSAGGCGSKGFGDLKAVHEEWLAHGGGKPFLTTGLPILDEKVKCQADHLWVIGARPKTGKTSFVVDLLARFADKQGAGLFYSLEMGADRIARKFAARLVPHEAYKRRLAGHDGLLTVAELLRDHSQRLYDLPIRIIDDQHTIEGICSTARHEIARNPEIKFLAIDYVEMITSREKLNGSVEIINHALRSLVALKKEIARPIFLISQLRRRSEEFSGEPSMDELKGSGLIEQSADVILLLWEGALTQSERDKAGDVYRKIKAKLVQRDGPHGVLDFAYYPQQSRFTTWNFD